jgi:RimJ/RimL family protein N-acetyltransferase
MSQPIVSLRPLTRTDLAAIMPWFEDPDTRRYLGGADWPAAGYIDCGTFDRATVYGGEGPDGPVITESIEVTTGSIAFAVDPALRRRGIGRVMIAALLARPALAFVELFEAGVEPENVACCRCLERAGFCARSPEPDYERMLYYRVARPAGGGAG